MNRSKEIAFRTRAVGRLTKLLFLPAIRHIECAPDCLKDQLSDNLRVPLKWSVGVNQANIV